MSAAKESHLCAQMNERNDIYNGFFEKVSVEKVFGRWRCGGPMVVAGVPGIAYCPFCGTKLPPASASEA